MTLGLYLADKSALERRHRSEAAAGFLAALAGSRALVTCAVVALEVLYSARNVQEYGGLESRLRSQPWLPVDERAAGRALEVQGLLVERGQHRLPIADLLIAAVAEVNDATVLHHDWDFERIAAVTGQPTRWVDGPPQLQPSQ
ncbi:MAG: PIN domain nuclease [Acidimicrobiales bacterium]|nr:PIN domain nuclease [Acidimicrobiales bacterium]